jgi:hypothetical protein
MVKRNRVATWHGSNRSTAEEAKAEPGSRMYGVGSIPAVAKNTRPASLAKVNKAKLDEGRRAVKAGEGEGGVFMGRGAESGPRVIAVLKAYRRESTSPPSRSSVEGRWA